MKLQYIRAFIVLLAGLISLIINMYMGREITVSLLIVLVVILLFYVIGTLIVEILQKEMSKKEELPEDDREDAEQSLTEETDSMEVHAEDGDEDI